MENSNAVSNLQILDAVNQAAAVNAATQCDDTTAILQDQAGTNLANMANTDRLGLWVDDNIYRSQLATRDAVERNADKIIDSVNYNHSHLSSAIDRTGSDTVNATLLAENEITNLIQSTTGDIKENQQAIALETRSTLIDGQQKTIEMNKDIVINDDKNAVNIELQASSNVYAVKKDVKHIDSHLELQAAQNTAQIQYEAVKLQGEASAEMADCCCELKEEVSKNNYETQKLAREIESKRLRDELAAATTESLINKLKYMKPYHPCPPPPCPPCPPTPQ